MTRIEEIVEDFEGLEPNFRLELLLDYADRLPPLPERHRNPDELESHRVHECASPVSLWVEVEAGKVHIYADVPPESPTVRGFISMLIEAFDEASPQEVLEAPTELLNRSGLAQAIGLRRMFGLSVIYGRIKQEVAEKAAIQQSR
jgi:cysteine desulfuration protein SufE